jgi:hypothetical protein
MEKQSNETNKTVIADLKKKHGRIFSYTTEDGKVCYLKVPDRKVLGFARETSGGNSVKFNETVIDNIFVGGDESIKIQDKYFFGLSAKVDDLIEIVNGELAEL